MFTDKDKENLIRLLNLVAQKASFTVEVKEMIEFVKLLNWAQVDLLPKIESKTFEVTDVKIPSKPSKGASK